MRDGPDTVTAFLTALEDNYRYNHDVAFYAHAMRLHPDSLTRWTRRLVGSSAKRIISDRLCRECRKLLVEGHSTAQVAQALGFSDPHYLSRFVRRQCGRTASQLRRASRA